MVMLSRLVVSVALLSGWMSVAVSAEIIREAKGLDEQVQDIKKDMLSISSELQQMEEKLLYPSSTQIAVFMTIPKGGLFNLDAVKISVDGKEVAHHVYTMKEVEALQDGAVQRIYTGNVKAGDHTLEVTAQGKDAKGVEYRESASYKFNKSLDAKLLEVSFAGPGKRIELKN